VEQDCQKGKDTLLEGTLLQKVPSHDLRLSSVTGTHKHTHTHEDTHEEEADAHAHKPLKRERRRKEKNRIAASTG
jgi:hypothetical protein